MRKPWLLIGPALLASVLALGVAACGDDDNDDAGDETPAATLPVDGEATEPPADEATEPPAATEPADGADAGATVITSEHPELGTILTDAQGSTVYTFDNDEPGVTNCTDGCADLWPPVLSDGEPTAGEGVPGQLALIERPNGTMQVTYNDAPLYYYSQDTAPSDANGQGVGDVWFVVEVP